MLVHNAIYRPVVRRAVERFFFTGTGGSFDFRFNLSLKARCALRPGDGPRAFGFSMLIVVGNIDLPVCAANGVLLR